MMSLKQFEAGAHKLCRVLKEGGGDAALLHWFTEQSSVEDSIFLKHPPVYSSWNTTASLSLKNEVTGDYDAMEESLIEDPDVEYEIPNNNVEWIFSIVYSETWQVPVLYFTVSQEDRIPCSRDQVLEILKEQDDSWEFVSYEEHPATGVPSLFLHPCQTKERMAQLLDHGNTPEQQLWSWMSLIFPTVGFSIPSKTFLRVQQKLKAIESSA